MTARSRLWVRWTSISRSSVVKLWIELEVTQSDRSKITFQSRVAKVFRDSALCAKLTTKQSTLGTWRYEL